MKFVLQAKLNYNGAEIESCLRKDKLRQERIKGIGIIAHHLMAGQWYLVLIYKIKLAHDRQIAIFLAVEKTFPDIPGFEFLQ